MLQTWRHQIPIGKQQFYKVPEKVQVRKSQHEDQTRFKAEGKEHVAFIYTFIYKECPESDGASIYTFIYKSDDCAFIYTFIYKSDDGAFIYTFIYKSDDGPWMMSVAEPTKLRTARSKIVDSCLQLIAFS